MDLIKENMAIEDMQQHLIDNYLEDEEYINWEIRIKQEGNSQGCFYEYIEPKDAFKEMERLKYAHPKKEFFLLKREVIKW